jgi:CDGSH-type Zn-finger protein
MSKTTQNKPFKIAVEEGKIYSWCSCGYSTKQPFCDGSHREFAPEYKSLKWIANADKEVYFCGCKKAADGNKPFCDGSHNKGE